jgi:hypothetical protein
MLFTSYTTVRYPLKHISQFIRNISYHHWTRLGMTHTMRYLYVLNFGYYMYTYFDIKMKLHFAYRVYLQWDNFPKQNYISSLCNGGTVCFYA